MKRVFIIRGKFGYKYIGRMSCNNRDRDQIIANVSQAIPRIAEENDQKL